MKLRARLRAALTAFRKGLTLSSVDSSRGWFTLFRSDQGSTFQYDSEITQNNVVANPLVYACVTLIASDVGKICLRLMSLVESAGIWIEAKSAAFSPLLRKPNHFQTRQQFIEAWILSKLLRGNAYILKQRDARKVVVAMYVLDPDRVTPLVAPDGAIYYECARDDLSKMPFDVPAIPASEIIHDRMECLFHPLVGISPMFAAYLSATQGLRITQNSEKFFANASRPSGILTSPGEITKEQGLAYKEQWEQGFTGENAGRLAVLGGGFTYSPLSANAVDSQMVEQSKLTGEQICSTFHVPAYMVGAGPVPANTTVQALNQQYYTQALQKLFNAIEDLLDDGLKLADSGYRTEFELDDLLRMDSVAAADYVAKLTGGGVMSPNEGRKRFALLPVKGGDIPYLQQQNFSLEALAKRDALDDPFAKMAGTSSGSAAAAPAAEPSAAPDDEAKAALETARLIASFTKGLEHV